MPAPVVVVALLLCASPAPGQTGGEPTRIGTYDSRAVALAFYNSEAHLQALKEARVEIERARAAGDEQLAAKLEAQMPFLQARKHWQVFSNMSIPNVIEKIAGELPAIAREAGVSAVVSKWELVYTDGSIEYVDLTPRIVALFGPNERVQKWLKGIGTREPIPLDKLPPEPDY